MSVIQFSVFSTKCLAKVIIRRVEISAVAQNKDDYNSWDIFYPSKVIEIILPRIHHCQIFLRTFSLIL